MYSAIVSKCLLFTHSAAKAMSVGLYSERMREVADGPQFFQRVSLQGRVTSGCASVLK